MAALHKCDRPHLTAARRRCRYDMSLAKYEEASHKTQVSLAFLNVGQNAIISTSLTAVMLMACDGIQSGVLCVRT